MFFTSWNSLEMLFTKTINDINFDYFYMYVLYGLIYMNSFLLFAEEGEYFLKVLIPSYAAGSIIGKGGQTIVQLQKETGATIKLSKSKDFYPGEWPDITIPQPAHFPTFPLPVNSYCRCVTFHPLLHL